MEDKEKELEDKDKEQVKENEQDNEAIKTLKEALTAKDSIIESLTQQLELVKKDLSEVNEFIERGKKTEDIDYMEDIV